jgi:hypothetical protein
MHRSHAIYSISMDLIYPSITDYFSWNFFYIQSLLTNAFELQNTNQFPTFGVVEWHLLMHTSDAKNLLIFCLPSALPSRLFDNPSRGVTHVKQTWRLERRSLVESDVHAYTSRMSKRGLSRNGSSFERILRGPRLPWTVLGSTHGLNLLTSLHDVNNSH